MISNGKKQDATTKPAAGRIPILRATNIDYRLTFSDLIYVPEEYVSKSKLLNVDDIVIAASSGSRHVVGKAAALTVPWVGSFGAFCYGLRPHLDSTASYISLFLQTSMYRDHVSVLSAGVNINNLRREHIEGIPLPVAPLTEQYRIVAKIEELFSELDKGVESLKTAREKLKVYRQALLKQAFEGKLTEQWRKENKDKLETPEQLLSRISTERNRCYQRQIKEWSAAVRTWEESGKSGIKPLKPAGFKPSVQIVQSELTELPDIPQLWQYVRLSEIALIGSGMSVNKSRKFANPIEIPYLSVANVQRGELDLSKVRTMEIEHSQLPRLALRRWDVLFNEGGDRDKLGRGWVWESQIKPCITQNHVFRSSPFFKSHPHSKWISHWGNTFGQLYFEAQGKQTTNLASINKTVLSRFPIPMPPIAEQEELVRLVEERFVATERSERSIDATLKQAETLRQSILKKAFAGQLVAQDPHDEPASVLLDIIRAEREQAVKNNVPRKTKKRTVA